MKNIMSLVLIFSLSQLWASHSPTANWQVFSKTIEQEFPVNAKGLTQIKNEWGKINVQTWKENKVKVIVAIKIQSPSAKKGQRILDHLTVDFANTAEKVSAKTTVLEPKKINWYSRRNLKVAIDYQVFIPESNDLHIEHHHGDIQIGQLTGGNIKIDLQSGNLIAEQLGTKANVQLVHGEAKLGQAGNLALQMNLSGLTAKYIESLSLDSKHSKVAVDKLGSLNGKSVFGKFRLGTVGDLSMKAHYDTVRVGTVENVVVRAQNSVFEVDQLTHSVDLDMELGKFVTKMSANFDQANLKGRHTHFSFYVPAESTFKMDVAARHGQLHYPDDFKPQYTVKTNVNKAFIGVFGQGAQEGLLKARYSNGSLSISKS